MGHLTMSILFLQCNFLFYLDLFCVLYFFTQTMYYLQTAFSMHQTHNKFVQTSATFKESPKMHVYRKMSSICFLLFGSNSSFFTRSVRIQTAECHRAWLNMQTILSVSFRMADNPYIETILGRFFSFKLCQLQASVKCTYTCRYFSCDSTEDFCKQIKTYINELYCTKRSLVFSSL